MMETNDGDGLWDGGARGRDHRVDKQSQPDTQDRCQDDSILMQLYIDSAHSRRTIDRLPIRRRRRMAVDKYWSVAHSASRPDNKKIYIKTDADRRGHLPIDQDQTGEQKPLLISLLAREVFFNAFFSQNDIHTSKSEKPTDARAFLNQRKHKHEILWSKLWTDNKLWRSTESVGRSEPKKVYWRYNKLLSDSLFTERSCFLCRQSLNNKKKVGTPRQRRESLGLVVNREKRRTHRQRTFFPISDAAALTKPTLYTFPAPVFLFTLAIVSKNSSNLSQIHLITDKGFPCCHWIKPFIWNNSSRFLFLRDVCVGYDASNHDGGTQCLVERDNNLVNTYIEFLNQKTRDSLLYPTSENGSNNLLGLFPSLYSYTLDFLVRVRWSDTWQMRYTRPTRGRDAYYYKSHSL